MCVDTITAWNLGKKPNGKSNIVFTDPGTGRGEYIPIPCGRCRECRLENSRVWAVRMMNEASLHEANSFITLTFNDDYVDPIGSLRKDVFQKFMKRLRKHLSVTGGPKVRFFHAGEYGEQFKRPHHHAIIFGYDFPDKILTRVRENYRYYESPLLFKLWSDPQTGNSYGFHEITDVSFESCAYVARYVCKKINGDKAEEHYTVMDDQGNFYKKVPEFATMSRRPGIGLGWYNQYKNTDVHALDRVHVRGNIFMRPPRYYDNQLEKENPALYEQIKLQRKKILKLEDDPWYHEKARGIIKESQYKMLKRTLD